MPRRSPSHTRLPFLPVLLSVVGVVLTAGCQPSGGRVHPSRLSGADSTAVADSLRAIVRSAYDLGTGEVVERMMSVYPAGGRIVSATGGRTTTTRDSLESAVRAFWTGVGQYMVRPTWRWEAMHVDVLDASHAVMTASYTVPHWTDSGRPHVIGGAWTTVWERRDGSWRVVHEHLSDLPRPMAERLEATMTPMDSATAANEVTERGGAHMH